MLTSEQRTEFDERGFVRIPSAFTAAEASAMEDLVWADVEAREGVIRGDPSTWNLTMVVGLGHLKTAPAFAAIGSPATVAALDDVLGAGRWVRPKNWGQLLVTFPTPDAEWTVPSDVWHTDFDYQLPPGEVAGALVFAFLADVGPRAGGTVVVAGSPRLIRRYVEDQPREALEKMKMKQVRKAFLASDRGCGRSRRTVMTATARSGSWRPITKSGASPFGSSSSLGGRATSSSATPGCCTRPLPTAARARDS